MESVTQTQPKSVRTEARVRVYTHTAEGIRAEAHAPTTLAPTGTVEVLLGGGVLMVCDTTVWPMVLERMIEAGNTALLALPPTKEPAPTK